MNQLTAQDILKEFQVLEMMAQSNRISERFCLDDYIQEEVSEAILALNGLYPEYLFEHKEVFGGFGHDLVVTHIERKEAYDQIPKTRTYGELFATLKREYGVATSASFHHKPTEGLTENEYQQTVDFYKKIDLSRLFDEDDEDE